MSTPFSSELSQLLENYQLQAAELSQDIKAVLSELDQKLLAHNSSPTQKSSEAFDELKHAHGAALVHFDKHVIDISDSARKLLLGGERPPTEQSSAPLTLNDLGLSQLDDACKQAQYMHGHHELHIDTRRHDGKPLWLKLELEQAADKSWFLLITDETELKLTQARLKYLSTHDELTGLANKNRFIQRSENALSRRSRDRFYRFAILIINFQPKAEEAERHSLHLNDHFLVEIGKRLHRCLRPQDMAAHLSTDDFAILVDDCATEENLQSYIAELEEALDKPMELDGEIAACSPTIGGVLVDSQYQTAEQILQDADSALIFAKKQNHRFYLFDLQLLNENKHISDVETRLRIALKQEHLELHYQPIVNLTSWRTVHLEALLRWNMSKTHTILPAEFINHANKSSVIHSLGQWVVDTACKQLATWQKQVSPLIGMSINISSRQFSSKQLIKDLESSLTAHPLQPDSLKLELAEISLLQEDNKHIEQLNEIRKLNCELLIDDFGCGFSSMNHLHQLPLSTVKIDRSLIAALNSLEDSNAIVKAIIHLAHNLGLSVIAEGVETKGQLESLLAMGCDMAQGFLFSEAKNSENTAELLHKDWQEHVQKKEDDELDRSPPTILTSWLKRRAS
ncbi:putative bifunctional diguanylate cyclase/phosphodiesterase [Agaribacterium sp. ZY112]|uniref:putative bifunctional diguanylate cyclase/phosphodiesterase n=1 Tax=Agaribacterium sp. ZY112 TaxID=3233574 RepID=UPI0035257073